jgi:hypothetical protein
MRCVGSTAIHICVAVAAGFIAGCSDSPSGFTLKARGGTYVDGTGRLGLAVLTTLRDGGGAGPDSEWTGALVGPMGAAGGPVGYAVPGAGSWAAAWWPEEVPYAGAYSLTLGPAEGGALSARFDVGEGSGLAPAQPSVSEDGTFLTWPAVAGAAAYECRISGAGGIVLRRLVTGPSCDVGELAPDGYSASVLAYSADVAALAQSGGRAPALPDRFDVSEARVAFTRAGSGAAPALIDAAGGCFSDGTDWTVPGLAIWVSIRNGDGSATSADWTVEVVGPGLDAAAPLAFAYPAHFSRILVWTGAVPAVQGSYGIVARSGDARVARSFAIGALRALGAPTGVTAAGGAQGSASASWTAVPGATSYLVTARAHASQAFVMNQWIAGTTAAFPAGTFFAGETYDVRVAATDADMVGGAVPAQLAITENSYQPASFVAR